jgi:FHA domain
VSGAVFPEGMAARTPNRPMAAEGMTERVDAFACLDERARRQATPTLPDEPGCYIEVQGPAGGLVLPLDDGTVHVGRGLAADLRLDESSVSRRHAILVHSEGGTRVLDDRSSNGTFVNGDRVTQADLHHGDLVALGRVVLRYLEV